MVTDTTGFCKKQASCTASESDGTFFTKKKKKLIL